MKIAWSTDPHLDHSPTDWMKDFFSKLNDEHPDLVLLGGDFTQGNTFDHYAEIWATSVRSPTLFVLGNHDFYFSSIMETRQRAARLVEHGMNYLSNGLIVHVDEETAIVGHDVWYDARNGNPKSRFELTDFSAIRDLKHLYPKSLLTNRLRELGDESALYFSNLLPNVLAKYKNVIVLTHVPPFVESCKYRGEPSSQDTLPFFSCQVVGRVLTDLMTQHPDRKMLVLSGHTHDDARVQILPNLTSWVGRAFYGQPKFEILDNLPF